MKKLILLFVLVAVITLAGIATANHYQNYQNKQTSEAQKAEALAQEKLDLLNVKYELEAKNLNTTITTLRAECEKGKQAYDALTPFAKTTQQAPNCL